MRAAYLFPLLAAMVSNLPAAGSTDEMTPYPTADAGFLRTVFRVPGMVNQL